MSLINIIQFAYDAIDHYADKHIENLKKESVVVADPLVVEGDMRISKAGAIELGNYEGLANTPYLCPANVKTVSLGLTKTDIKDLPLWPWNKFLTDEQAVKLYIQKVQHYVDAVNSEVFVPLKQHEFDALVSITYNIGTGNLKTDKGGMAGSTFIDLVNAKADPKRIVAAMKLWNRADGRVLKGLVSRRKAEADLYLTGRYKNNGTVARIAVNPNTHRPIYKGRVNIEPYI